MLQTAVPFGYIYCAPRKTKLYGSEQQKIATDTVSDRPEQRRAATTTMSGAPMGAGGHDPQF